MQREKRLVLVASGLICLTVYFSVITLDTFKVAVEKMSEEEERAAQTPSAASFAAPHPRLILSPQLLGAIREKIAADPAAKANYDNLLKRAARMREEPPISRPQDAAIALDRFYTLGLAYHLTGDQSYSKPLVLEVFACSRMKDWSPQNPADVCAMTHAVALGYDWIYDQLPALQQNLIKKVIIEKGFNVLVEATGKNPPAKLSDLDNAYAALAAHVFIKDEPESAQRVLKIVPAAFADPAVAMLAVRQQKTLAPEALGLIDAGFGVQQNESESRQK